MSDKTVQLKDRDGNNLYPKTPLSNVIGLAPGLNNRHIFFGSGTPSNVKSSYEDIQVNDLYIDTSTSTRDGIFYRVSSFYTADVPKISWDMYGYYFMKSGTPPTTDSDWSMAFGGAASPYPRKGLLWCDTNTGHIYEFVGAPNNLQWRCLTDNYSKSELDTMIAAFQPDIDEKADRIEDSRQGSAITLEDSAEIDIPEITLFGKSVQNGTPSIDNPVAIEDVSSENILVKKKNLLTLADIDRTNIYKYQCTYVFSDNSIKITSTAAGNSVIGRSIVTGNQLPSADRSSAILIPCIGGQSIIGSTQNNIFDFFVVYVLDETYTCIEHFNFNSGAHVLHNDAKWMCLQIGKKNTTSGTTYTDNIQLEVGITASEFEYYVTPQNATLSKPLRGIPVTSGGNYTDNNGQQWICDTIEKYEDGSGKYIQRVGTYTIDSNIGGYDVLNPYTIHANTSIFRKGLSNAYIFVNNLAIMSDNFIAKNIYSLDEEGARTQYANNKTNIEWRISNSVLGITSEASATEVKTAFNTFITNKSFNFILPIEPIETPLTAEELVQLDLSTYYPITNITSNPDIKITYVADTKNYFDKKIEQIQNAIISNGGNV